MANPIWKDYYLTLGTKDSYQYRIEIDGVAAYEGVAHKRPGMGYVSIKLNDIVADYLSIELTALHDTYKLGGDVECAVITEDGELARVTFYADWSYDRNFNANLKGLSDPVNHRVTLATPLPFSSVDADEYEFESLSSSRTIYIHVDEERASYCMLNLREISSQEEDINVHASNTASSQVYHIVDSCAKFALYYVNAYGGVDMLLIEGNHSERDNLTRYSRQVEYDNRNINNRGKGDYAVELSKTLTLHTSWLSDDEASRMHHLLNSPQVCLFDIALQQMIPVVLTNTTTEYKTYKGNGGKLVQYAIDVTLANDRVRR